MGRIGRQTRSAKNGSFAGVGKGEEPLGLSILAYGTAQNVGQNSMAHILGSGDGSMSPIARFDPAGAKVGGTSFDSKLGPLVSKSHTIRALPHWVCIYLLTFPQPLHAQIVADSSAHHAHQPQILSAGQNVPVVNIQTPNGAGVSVNHYFQFDVPSQGAILNNARVDVNTERAGQVKGNASLAGGTANLILNQINSPNASQLKGFLEVAGDRASVVVANPSGITCDGCGFINTPHTTLTTGKPILSGSGALEGYRVESGTVTFQGSGLNSKNTDYTDVLARAVKVNAQVQAGKELRIVTGRNAIRQKGEGTPMPTPLENRSDKPAFALDVAALGGMYAGLIHMVGTEAGVGVRISGTVSAESGDVVLDVHGPASVSGKIQGAKNVRVKAKGDVDASGTLLGQAGDVHVDAEGNLTIGGHVDAKNTVALKGKNLTAHKGSTLTAREGHLQLTANDALTVKGTAKARHTLSTEGNSLDLSGSTLEAQDLSTTARLNDIKLSGSTITSGHRFGIKTTKALITDSATISASKLEISALSLSNVGGKLTHSGVEAFALKGLSFLDNTQGKIESKGASFTLEVGRLTNTDGALSHEGEGLMSIKVTENIITTGGEISSSSDLRIEAVHVNNDGGLISGVKTLWIKAKSLLNANTSENMKGLSSKGTMTLTLDEELDNARGLIRTKGDVTLTSGFLTNTDGTLSADSRLNITAYGITAHRGLFKTFGDMTINTQGQSFDLTEGTLDSTGDLEITSGDVTTDRAKVTAHKKSSLNVGTLRNHDGNINVTGGLDITASGNVINIQTLKETPASGQRYTKGISSGGPFLLKAGGTVDNSRGYMMSFSSFTLTSRDLTNVDGVITGEKTTTIDTQGHHLDNRRGHLWAREILNITSGLMTNIHGVTTTDGRLTVTSGQIKGERGTFESLGNLTINTQGQSFDLTAGLVNSAGDLTITSGDLTNDTGKIRGAENVKLTTGKLSNRDGLIDSQDTLEIDTQGHHLDNSRGKLWSKEDLTLKTGLLTNTDGTVATDAGLKITSGEITAHRGRFSSLGAMRINTQGQSFDVTGGSVVAGKFDPMTGEVIEGHDLEISSGDLTTDRAHIVGSKKAILKVGTLRNHDGLISAQEALDITASGDVVNTQTTKETPGAHQPRTKGLRSDGALTLTLTKGGNVDNTRGAMSSGGDFEIKEAGLITNKEGRLFGKGAVSFTSSGLDNTRGSVLGDRLSVKAGAGTITNTDGTLISRNGPLTLSAKDILNTGRIYGDSLAIQATHLTNTAENGRAGTIATRGGDLHLGVGTLTNEKGALIQSLGNLSIGGSLDGDNKAQGKATRVENVSARIEASQNVSIGAHELLNKNDGLRYELQMEDTFGAKEHLWQDEGWCQFGDRCEHSTYTRVEKPVLVASDPAQIRAGQKVILNVDDGENYASQIVGGLGVFHEGVELKNTTLQVTVRQWDGRRTYGRGPNETWDWHYEMVDYGHKERWTERPYAPTLTEKTVDVLPATITLNSSTPDISGLGEAGVKTGVVFDPTAVSAPVLSSLHTAALLEIEAELITHTPLDRAQARDVAQAFIMNLYGVQGNGIAKDWSFAGVGKGAEPLSSAPAGLTDQNSPLAWWTGFDPAGARTGVLLESGDGGGGFEAAHPQRSRMNPGLVVTQAPDVPPPVSEKYLIRMVEFSPDIPMASLFTPRPEPTATYLVETDPAFTDRKQWLSSDVQLVHMGLDPALAQKRVGDGFYEQMLVRDQLIKLTGYRYFAGYEDDLTQYAALLASGAVFGKRYGLIPGVALTAQQMTKLTSPIVWLVKSTVRLKDGSIHDVLVPRVYAVVRPGALRGDGALISGRDVKMAMGGTLVNQGGTIAGAERTEISAQTLANLMGRVGDGGLTKLDTQEDLLNSGGSIRGGSVAINVGRDFVSETTTKSNASQSGSGDNVSHSSTTTIDRQASVTATDGDGTLSIRTGRDTLLKGSTVENRGTGETSINTGRNFTADSVQTREEVETRYHYENESFLGNTSSSGSTHTVETKSHGTKISGGGDVTVSAGFGIAKDWSFAGVGKGAEPFNSSIPAYGTAQNVGQERLVHILGSGNGYSFGLGTVFDPAGAGASSSSLRAERGNPGEGHLTLKNTTITSGGKTTITSTGTTTFAHDMETKFSQTTSSNVGLFWQTHKDAGVHNDKTWNEKKESLTPTGSALVGLGITALTLLSGGTAAGALGITNMVGAAAFNAGTMSFATQLAINTINAKGDVGKALEGVSAKQIAVATAAAALSAGVISHISPDVTPRLDSNFKAGAGAGTKLADMGTTQSASFASISTQATSASTWVQGFTTRLPVHMTQTVTNVAASAVLSDGDPSAIGNAALGSLATVLGSEATLPVGQWYHSSSSSRAEGVAIQDYALHKVLHGAIGCGTGALQGGSCAAGAAGAVAAELAGEVYLNHKLAQGLIMPDQAAGLVNTTASIGRIVGGLAGFAAGGDPNTGANTGTIAAENNVVGTILDMVQMGDDGRRIVKGLQTGDSAMVKEGVTDLILDAAATALPGIPAGLQKLPRLMREGAEAVTQKLGAGAAKEAGEKELKSTGSLSAEQANKEFTEKYLSKNPHAKPSDVRPPYAEGTRARDIILDQETPFIRVHQKRRASSEWVMRPEEFAKLRTESDRINVPLEKLLQDRFALPKEPTHLSIVNVPSGTRIRIGKAAPQDGWGKGGGIQYELEKILPDNFYKYEKPITDYLKSFRSVP